MKVQHYQHVQQLKKLSQWLSDVLDQKSYSIDPNDLAKVQKYIDLGLKVIEQLQQENKELEIKRYKLEERIKILDKIESERGELLSRLAEIQTNLETSYISGKRPQNHLLAEDFKHFTEQGFHFVSREIFKLLSGKNSSFKENSKYEIAQIKAIISHHIFIKGMKLVRKNNNDISVETVNHAVQAISSAFCSALQINENLDIEYFKNNIEALVRQQMRLIQDINVTNTITELVTEEDFSKAVKFIRESIYKDLKIDDIPETLKAGIDNLATKGLELLQKIANAEPPGQLVLPIEGELFNCDQHEAMNGCDDKGKVKFAIFPAYVVGTRTFEKAVVFTVAEEKNSNDVDNNIFTQGKAKESESSATSEQQEITQQNLTEDGATSEQQEISQQNLTEDGATSEQQEISQQNLTEDGATSEQQEISQQNLTEDGATSKQQEISQQNLTKDGATSEQQEISQQNLTKDGATSKQQEITQQNLTKDGATSKQQEISQQNLTKDGATSEQQEITQQN